MKLDNKAVLVGFSPLLGIPFALLLIIFFGTNAISPQGGGGDVNCVGMMSILFVMFGWIISLPLAVLLEIRSRSRGKETPPNSE
jgi:hypothetical protein